VQVLSEDIPTTWIVGNIYNILIVKNVSLQAYLAAPPNTHKECWQLFFHAYTFGISVYILYAQE
jgi:hypothetical protein